jgi:hypothetical protein
MKKMEEEGELTTKGTKHTKREKDRKIKFMNFKMKYQKIIIIFFIAGVFLFYLIHVIKKKSKNNEIQMIQSQVIDLKERVEFLEKKLNVTEERQFEKEQSSKGLVKFEGRWMSREEQNRLIEDEKKRQVQYQQVQGLPKPRGKGLVYYYGKWVTPDEKLEMEKMEKEKK